MVCYLIFQNVNITELIIPQNRTKVLLNITSKRLIFELRKDLNKGSNVILLVRQDLSTKTGSERKSSN
jgi:hypothetical protein